MMGAGRAPDEPSQTCPMSWRRRRACSRSAACLVVGDLLGDDGLCCGHLVLGPAYPFVVSSQELQALGYPVGITLDPGGELGDLGQRHPGAAQVQQHLEQVHVLIGVVAVSGRGAGRGGDDPAAFEPAQGVGIEAEPGGARPSTPGSRSVELNAMLS